MWIVVNIGCLECGVSSAIVGVFDTETEADIVARACGDKFEWRQGGQNSFEVFALPEPGRVADEYRRAFA